MILSDRFLLTFGFACVLACSVLQFERHALWFQQTNPFPSPAVVGHGR